MSAIFFFSAKGCFLDKSDRAMKGHMFNGAYMTQKICIEQCGEMVGVIYLPKLCIEQCGGDGKCDIST